MSLADIRRPAGEDFVALVADALPDELPAAVALRHRLHRDPRPSGFEDDTADEVCAAIAAPLDGIDPGLAEPDTSWPDSVELTEAWPEPVPGTAGLEPRRVAGTGRLLRLGPARGPSVALRAELDALPLLEHTGLPYASTSGVMHACGHDLHLAALVAVARAVRRVRRSGQAELPAGVLLVLQPREEAAPSGAADVVADPAFTAHDVRAVIGAHVQPVLPRGRVSARPGPVNASSDELVVTVSGRGGHAAYPHLTDDPVLALSATVVALHHLVSRRVNPLDSAVLAIGKVAAGTANNVVPPVAKAFGTLRALDPADRVRLREAARQVVEHTAASYGCTGTLELVENEPALHNDPRLAAAILPALAAYGLRPDETFRSCGSDDFAHFSEVLPAVMMFVGVGEEQSPDGGAPGLHDARFAPPDAVIGEVARAYLAGLSAALRLLP
jgi:amidohydrolase